jgi:hypothetical protein
LVLLARQVATALMAQRVPLARRAAMVLMALLGQQAQQVQQV